MAQRNSLFLLLWTLCSPVASGEQPPPDYRAEVSIGAWYTVNAQLETAIRLAHETPDLFEQGELNQASKTHFHKAIIWADAFENQVFETAGLAYLKGLIWMQLNDVARAKKEYLRSLKLDPDGIDTLFDLGELYMIEQKYDDAKACYQPVRHQKTTGSDAWRASLRLAEIAGHQANPIELELYLREAIQRGFPLAQIARYPAWSHFYRDAELRDKIYKLYLVYGDARLLRELKP